MVMVKVKKGDTLIEVMLAIGIFSMIAIAITAVMSSGSTGAQTALETTLAREEIDTQAEAIRFIQTSYAVDKNAAKDIYAKLWKDIISKPAPAKDEILQYNPTSCDSLYNNSNPAYDYAFIINPRALGTFSDDGSHSAIFRMADSTGPNLVFHQASTYPRLVFGNAITGTSDNSGSLLNNNGNDLLFAEGLYVIAVKDDGTTDVIDAAGKEKNSGFYDFYIRSCWYGSDADEPTTISTVIRLYDPDAITTAGFVSVNFQNPSILSSPTPPGGTVYRPSDYDFFSKKEGKKVTLPKVDSRNGWEFHWEIISSTATSGASECVKAGYFDSGSIVTNECPGTITYTLQGKWKHVHYDITYDTSANTYPEGYAIGGDTISFSPQTCFSDNYYDNGAYKTDGCTLHGRINHEGKKLSASGYKVVGWCNDKPTWDSVNKKHRCGRDFFAVSGNTTTGPDINQGPNPNFPNYFGPEENGVRKMTLYPVWETNNETYAIQLSWNAAVDYEANLYGYKSNGTAFTAYYGSLINNDLDGTKIAVLNHDCTAYKEGCANNWNETFILNTYGARSYYYYVCRFSPGTCGGTVNTSSNLTVKVYLKDSAGDTSLTIVEPETSKDRMTYNNLQAYNDDRWTLVKTYNISGATGNSGHIWNVFAYKDGEIYDKNTITNTVDTSY